MLDADEGEPQRARAGYLEALALAREVGDIAGQSRELQALGARDLRQGQVDIARTELVEALRLARQVEQPALIAAAAGGSPNSNERKGIVRRRAQASVRRAPSDL